MCHVVLVNITDTRCMLLLSLGKLRPDIILCADSLEHIQRNCVQSFSDASLQFIQGPLHIPKGKRPQLLCLVMSGVNCKTWSYFPSNKRDTHRVSMISNNSLLDETLLMFTTESERIYSNLSIYKINILNQGVFCGHPVNFRCSTQSSSKFVSRVQYNTLNNTYSQNGRIKTFFGPSNEPFRS